MLANGSQDYQSTLDEPTMRLIIFLHGTVIMHPSAIGRTREERVAQVRIGADPTLRDYAEYVPVDNAVAKLQRWREQNVRIDYLSSHRNSDDVAKDDWVLQKYSFPSGRVLARADGESYGQIVAREMPDVLIEDNCESIGADQISYLQIRPELRSRIKSIIIPEFGGIDHLPDASQSLLTFEVGDTPPFMRAFVLQPQPVNPVRETNLDLYLPGGDERGPAVVFVHGGPVRKELRPRPRDWPVYQGYGSAAAMRGLVAATFDHGFYDFDLIKEACEDIAQAVDRVRAHPRVDPDRIAMWFFSGGGMLMGNWLSEPPSWLRCVAASYPICSTQDELGDVVISPIEALRSAGELPILLTRAGLEQTDYAKRVEVFVATAADAGANLEIIDVPDGHHGFDVLDHTDQSMSAVERGLDWLGSRLREEIAHPQRRS